MRGEEVYRVTGRKNEWGEVEDWICNTCRFEKKEAKDWIIEGPTEVNRNSVIAQGQYAGNVGTAIQPILIDKVIGQQPKLTLDIHEVSDVNRERVHLSEIKGPAHSDDFK